MKKVRPLLVFFVIAALLVSGLQVSAASPVSVEGKVRVWVQFSPGTKGVVEKVLKNSNAELHYTFDELDAFAVTLPASALNGIQRNPNVILVEEDSLRYPVAIMPSNSYEPSTVQTVPYGIDMVQARDVWDVNRDGVIDTNAPTGNSIKLCIIDSGLLTTHEDIVGVSAEGLPTNIDVGDWTSDGGGHGTHVAGTITAVNNSLGVVGVMPGTGNLLIMRVFGDDGLWAYSSTLINAANLCRDNGAKVISMSLGGSKSNRLEQRGFDTLYNQGILSIAAAGNGGTSAYSYPASYSSVVSVAAIDENKVIADFSQFNDQVELAAPGVGVLSTVPWIDTSTVTVDGVTYSGFHIEGAPRGTASGSLENGGLCDSTGA